MGVSAQLTGTRISGAFPDPPFDVPGEPPTGFDVDLMKALSHISA